MRSTALCIRRVRRHDDRLAQPAQVVGTGVGGHVGGVDGDHRQPELPGRRAAARAEHHRPGQVHEVGTVLGDGGADLRSWQADPEFRVDRQATDGIRATG